MSLGFIGKGMKQKVFTILFSLLSVFLYSSDILSDLSPYNTSSDEMRFYCSEDEHIVFFTRNQKIIGHYLLDDSLKLINTKYLSSKYEQSIHFISPDGQFIIYSENQSNGSVFYKTSLMGVTMSAPQQLSIKIPQHFIFKDAAFNNTMSQMVFSAKQEGLSYDLYSMFLTQDSSWSPPVPLGININSNFNEYSPYLHPSGQFLYFSSDRTGGKGGMDIYRSTFQDGIWLAATPMQALNSSANEIGVFVSMSGQKAVYSSDRLENNFNFYMQKFPRENISLTLVKGRVVSEDTQNIPTVQIRVYEAASHRELKYVYNPNYRSGSYLLILPPGKSYQMEVDAQGYELFTKEIRVPAQAQFYQLKQEIRLKKSQQGKSLAVEVYNSFDIDAGASLSLEDREKKLLEILEGIIQQEDTLALKNVDQFIENKDPQKSKKYQQLLDLVENAFKKQDLKALELIESRDNLSTQPRINLFFPSNGSSLDQEQKDSISLFLRTFSEISQWLIVGHSDHIGTPVSKYVISSLRAQSVAECIDALHFSGLYYSLVIKGDQEPLVDFQLQSDVSSNRRVEIIGVR